MFRAMHSFILSKLRIVSHKQLQSHCNELAQNHQKAMAILTLRSNELEQNHQKTIADLTLRCNELEQNQQTTIADLALRCDELALNQQKTMVALASRCDELELNQHKTIAALALRCDELELNQQQKMTALQSNYDERESIQKQKMADLESCYDELGEQHSQKNSLLAAHCDKLEHQFLQLQAIQEGLTIALKQSCKLNKQLLQKNATQEDIPYLQCPLPFKEQLKQLQLLEPNAFDLWWQCFLNAEKEYNRTIEGNLSYGLHFAAAEFNDFLKPFLHGNILDVGCGPQIIPSYLHGSIEKEDVRFFGIDPLYAEHPFEFYHGFAEFLPWQANCFDLVICATSLDHCLSLKKSLEEIKRVLKRGGKFLVWVGFIPGGKAYDPKSNDISPVDNYHLFHFDREWFEPLMKSYFNFIDSIKYDDCSHFYVFSS